MTDKVELYETIGIVVMLFIGCLIFLSIYIKYWLPFKWTKDYIKMKMMRSHGDEYLYWRHKLRMLYVSKIPILRSVVRRKYNR